MPPEANVWNPLLPFCANSPPFCFKPVLLYSLRSTWPAAYLANYIIDYGGLWLIQDVLTITSMR